MGKAILGIDVGGSTTKIVGFREENGKRVLIEPQCVRATDPLTSIYGAFGKFTMQNGLALSDIERVMMTGAGATFLDKPLYEGLDCRAVPEFNSVGLGGLYLSNLDEAVVVSMGTGTALIHAKQKDEKTSIRYLGGTGVGGGTLVGLSRKILGVDTIEHIEQLCEGGDLSNIDLRIKDISTQNIYHGVNTELTASNFGKLSDLANKHDIALGIVNMVAETIGMLAVFAARNFQLDRVVLTGNLTAIAPIRHVFDVMEKNFGIRFIIPQNAQYGTVIGAALCPTEDL
ncbi:MAG: type II pantothenate kinase [Clostridia bacterium]|nr:type II pantothenate kinase [Clostridia bacterium]